MNRLENSRDEYADENLPVFLLLGLVSALRRVEPLLPPPGPLHPLEPATGDGATAGGPGRFLYLVLGLVAFRRHLRSTLTHPRAASASAGAPCAETPAARVPGLREMLR